MRVLSAMAPIRISSSALLLLTCLSYLTLSSSIEESQDSRRPHDSKGRFSAFSFFRNPASLFVSSATISLTDDNSTFFAARPAAFGPLLPHRGLSGQIWIGNGFSGAALSGQDLTQSHEGELGCSDIPDWTPGDESEFEAEDPAQEDDVVEYSDEISKHFSSKRSASNEDQREVADIRFLKESAEINGKVVLLSRGGCGFVDKVKWAQSRGATAVIVGDNLLGGPLVRMYARGDTSNITIPSIFTSHTTAHLLSSLIPRQVITGGPLPASTTNELLGEVEHEESKQSSESGKPQAGEMGSSELSETTGKVADTEDVKHKTSWLVDFFTAIGFRLDHYDSSLSSKSPSSGYLIWKKIRHFDEEESSPKQKRSVDAEPSTTPSSTRENTTHSGLWVTLTPSDINTSPFFNTLFVLVVSPLVTLAIVYSMLLLRSRIRRRRWRAPKSIVERLPVRIYQALTPRSAPTSPRVTPAATDATPLLADARPVAVAVAVPPAARYGALDPGEKLPQSASVSSAGGRRLPPRQIECVVCLEEYEDGVSKVMSLPCGHEFHADCITPWLTTRRRTCPICKGDVVRSLRRQSSTASSSPQAQTHLQGQEEQLPGQEELIAGRRGLVAADAMEEEIQAQAAETRNQAPEAAMPIPTELLVRRVGGERGGEVEP